MITLLIHLNALEAHRQHLAAGEPADSEEYTVFMQGDGAGSVKGSQEARGYRQPSTSRENKTQIPKGRGKN